MGQKNCLEKKGKGKDYDAHPLSKTHEPPLLPFVSSRDERSAVARVGGGARSKLRGRPAARGRRRGTTASRTGDAPGGRRGAHPAAAPTLLVSAHGVPCLRHSVPPEAVMDWASERISLSAA